MLQKKIKKLPPKQEQQGEQQGQQQHPPGTLTNEETEFVQALSDTLNQLNDVYIEKEETSVIRVERLESELATATTPEQLNELHKQFVDFHGEVLLLVHWSILAYTATVKILKKHHKRTGLLVKAPELGNLLSQPFCSTEVCDGLLFPLGNLGYRQLLLFLTRMASCTHTVCNPPALAAAFFREQN